MLARIIRNSTLSLLLTMYCVAESNDDVQQILSLVPDQRGIVSIVELNSPDEVQTVIDVAKARELTVFFQSADPELVLKVRQAAEREKLLGERIFVDQQPPESIPLSHNLADSVIVSSAAQKMIGRDEVLRVLRPMGLAWMGDHVMIKPKPPGMDDWTHPYHGPDNNTQSNDQLVRGDFQTQFIEFPQFSPMPEQSVVAGGRIYKAMGNIAHKANQNEMLNTLLCINSYNGSILWKRPLPEGFMIHRNTMVAQDDALYMGDHQSCKVFDAVTGEVRQEFTVPTEITDGPVWKWMAVQGDTIFALVGNLEVEIRTLRSDRPGIGHWPWGMWDGHDYNDPRTAFGHGRTLVAMNRRSGQILWHHRDPEFLDARAVCMKNDRIYAYSPEKYLLCLDARNGQVVWQNSSQDLLEAIGPNQKAQHYITGYATSAYMKCNDSQIFFAGPQRERMVVASTEDGRKLWTNDVGNLQLVLRKEAIYAAGPENTRGMLLNYENGEEIASLPARRACTRATGCADSVFFRARGGTVRIMAATEQAGVSPRHIAPMRPPCQDGVLVSNGHLYWGPWMCGCELSLYGNIGLRPVETLRMPQRDLDTATRHSLVQFADWQQVKPLPLSSQQPESATISDRRLRTEIRVPGAVQTSWSTQLLTTDLPTAPVAAGGLIFVADRMGAVRALDSSGQIIWTTYTGGAIFYPPRVAHDRVFVGSADGRVYALEAATGRKLWTYRVSPTDSRISVYGKIVSRWPVAGGVVVVDDQVYAAAGITHYDGTYVVALDVTSGEPQMNNDTSGRLSEEVDSGISLQGELKVAGEELQFAGGGIYEVARFRLTDLECLNEPRHEISSQYRTAFYAWYPNYNRYESLEYQLDDGRVLTFDASYDGSEFSPLSLEPNRPLGMRGQQRKDLAGEFLRRRGKEATPKYLWQDQQNYRFTSLVVGQQALLAAGHQEATPQHSKLLAIDIETGATLWSVDLPAATVKSGLAMDSNGSVYAALENGELHCWKVKN